MVERTNLRLMGGRTVIGTMQLDMSPSRCNMSKEQQYAAQLFTSLIQRKFSSGK